MARKHVLVICGTGVATSTVVSQKIRAFLDENGLDATISQGAVADLLGGGVSADFVVSTTTVPDSVGVPVIQGMPFLTGMGVDGVYEQIRAQFD
ncbi:PTS sugar transporter subunit IIB [Sediminivirga luteola]|jgi:PTS system galactitol-specific IIB component|uniref:PTS galactitol transporter subunit IIB n=1 Tax=Sediminivirga luteola TaxID=1774748 RepID=A0A8J2TW15_9MICO|nr:PTS sugar transporter subunit IIB [Sediminivirga luteola]MCI2264320.1 PTS sugar transporter subunit IIB [Sediminivirga luteola]GGA05297.1 PTS galactitol transporter subunit IIB [Sediminivirga luteola]